ncbi:hypothetical protein JW949_02410 [Candidatus Woesearchaeota archaeon]|nr:hypothetical protein [Candidatus Woesearchaeota archaeon]
MSLTEKIKNTASDIASWVNENKKTLGLTTLGLYMGLIGCSKGPSKVEIIPEEVTKIGECIAVSGYDVQDKKAVAMMKWNYHPISIDEGMGDIQHEIDDGDKEPIELEVLQNADNTYLVKPIRIGGTFYSD